MQQIHVRDLHKRLHVPGARTVTCVIPNSWSFGKTGMCYVYNSTNVNNSTELGTISITILPTSNNEYKWSERWQPSL